MRSVQTSGNEAGLLGQLNGLRAALRTEFVKDAARVGLDRVLADEEALGDFAITKASGDQTEDFEFARGDAEVGETLGVGGEGRGRGGGWRGERGGLAASQGEAEPNAEGGEHGGDESTVNFEGVFDDEEAIFSELEDGDEDAAGEAVEKDVAESTEGRSGGRVRATRHGEDDTGNEVTAGRGSCAKKSELVESENVTQRLRSYVARTAPWDDNLSRWLSCQAESGAGGKGAECGEESLGIGVVAEGSVEVGEEVAIAGSEDEAGAELERILAGAMLALSRGASAGTCDAVIAAKDVEEVAGFQCGGFVGGLIGVDKEWEGDAGFFAEERSVAHITKTDGGEMGTRLLEIVFTLAQLRDEVAAEDSAVVAKEHDDGGCLFPKRAEANVCATGLGKDEVGEFGADGVWHKEKYNGGSLVVGLTL